jgi:shikimate dehydrogenase
MIEKNVGLRRLDGINPKTQLCAVIGNPVEHSLSPAIHNAAFAELGLDFVYVAFRVEDVAAALAGMRALENFRGLSVTIPHKMEIMKHVDEIPEVDRRIGSINTVISEGGRLRGFGTDGPGALRALGTAGIDVDGRSVLMIGAGGASRAIAFTLAEKAPPAEIALLDLDGEVLKGLASDLEVTGRKIESALMEPAALEKAMAKADLVVNCTPVGMHPKTDGTPVPADLLRPGQAVFDIVYTPLETRLLREARERGLATLSGVEMFVYQAVLQFEEFTGKAAPEDVMRRVVMERLST